MPSPKHKVISVGANPELIWLRNAVLQSAGFEVVSTLDLNDAIAGLRQGDCGVLLVCYSLPSHIREPLVKTFRESCPDSRIVAVAGENMEKPEFADSYVYGIEGPEVLIEAIRGYVSKAGLD